MSTPATLSFNGYEIGPDENGDISLTLLWKSAGANSYKKPFDWARKEGAEYLANAASDLKVAPQALLKTKAGRNGGTKAIPEIALAYATYLSKPLARLVNQTFLQRVAEEKNPELILDRAVKTYERRGFSAEHIATRLNAKATRVLFTAALARHGVTGEGFRLCTNATYFALFGGPAALVRQKVGAGPKDNPRDHMTMIQLRTVELSEMLATEGIEKSGAYGNEACVNEANRAARNVARLVTQHRAGASF